MADTEARQSELFEPVMTVIYTIALVIGAVSLVLLAVPVAVDVFLRHAGSYFPGAFEIQELMMGTLAVSGMIVVSCRDRHIAIDFLYQRFSLRVRQFLDALFEFMGLVFFSILGWEILVLAFEKVSGTEVTSTLHIPLFVPMLFFGFCMVIFACTLLIKTLRCFIGIVKDGVSWFIPLIILITVLTALFPWILEYAGIFPTRAQLGVFGMLFFMVVLFMGFPLGYAMGISGFIGLLCLRPDVITHFNTLSMTSYSSAFSATLAVVPLFCLMGELSLVSGISSDMFKAARIWMGRTPASLGIAAIIGCAGFAAICGDSLACGVTMASVALPEMRKHGYEPAFSCATLACGGTLGVLIPPSLSFIIYAIVNNVVITLGDKT